MNKENIEIKKEEIDQSSKSIIMLIYEGISIMISFIANYLIKFIDKLIPPFAPLIDLNEKLIPKEEKQDYTLIRHYNEFQILMGFFLFIFGIFIALAIDELLWIIVVLGFILVITGFEIEEIYITNIRLLIRRIGFIERIIRVPSDEEHLLNHIVSFNIGRAPINKIISVFAIIGPVLITLRELEVPKSLPSYLIVVILILSVFILIIGMRLGRRILVIHLAGGHTVILGQRKGIPEHMLKSLMNSIYKQYK